MHAHTQSATALWFYIYGSLGVLIKRIIGHIPTWKLHPHTQDEAWIHCLNLTVKLKHYWQKWAEGEFKGVRGIKEKCSWLRRCRRGTFCCRLCPNRPQLNSLQMTSKNWFANALTGSTDHLTAKGTRFFPTFTSYKRSWQMRVQEDRNLVAICWCIVSYIWMLLFRSSTLVKEKHFTLWHHLHMTFQSTCKNSCSHKVERLKGWNWLVLPFAQVWQALGSRGCGCRATVWQRQQQRPEVKVKMHWKHYNV